MIGDGADPGTAGAPMTVTATLSDQLDAVIAEETDAFVARPPGSRAFRDRARHLAGGATSN